MERNSYRKKINNAFYEELHDAWYEETKHPIALLRAENDLRNPWIASTIREKFSANVEILDIGCGGGFLTNFLAKQGHKVHGVDLSLSSLQLAKSKDTSHSVKYKQADASILPYPDAIFDVVCAMDLLEHVESPSQVISEASRTLKKNGFFFFHTFNKNFLSYLLIIKGVEWCVPSAPDNMHVYSLFIQPEKLRQICLNHTLQVEYMIGVRPDFMSSSFIKMLFKRQIDERFRFVFTPSLLTGYSGYAKKSH